MNQVDKTDSQIVEVDTPPAEKPLISVVIPCYYSEKMIRKVVTMTREELVSNGYPYEFILVNDGSRDGTFAEIEKLANEDSQVVGIDCSKNLGQHSATMAGLHHVHGDLIMLMDDDMQTHPSQCMTIIHAMEETDDDVVFGQWPRQKTSWWRLAGSKFTTWSMQVMTKRPKEVEACNFLVMKRAIAEELKRYTGPYIYIQGLLFRATTRMSNVAIKHFEREEGTSGYTLKTLIKLWSTILNFSMMPLRAASFIGTVLGVIGLISGIVVVVSKFVVPNYALGWPSLMAAVLFCSGLILMSLGIIGEYLGRVFMTLNNSPQYVIRTLLDRRD